jgi:hypothetical protein
MQTNSSATKNVVAPEQKVKSVTEHISDYLLEIGFKAFGVANEHDVFTKPISETAANFLYCFVKGATIRCRQGFRKETPDPERNLKATVTYRNLYTCKVSDLEETVGLLSEQNYL